MAVTPGRSAAQARLGSKVDGHRLADRRFRQAPNAGVVLELGGGDAAHRGERDR